MNGAHEVERVKSSRGKNQNTSHGQSQSTDPVPCRGREEYSTGGDIGFDFLGTGQRSNTMPTGGHTYPRDPKTTESNAISIRPQCSTRGGRTMPRTHTIGVQHGTVRQDRNKHRVGGICSSARGTSTNILGHETEDNPDSLRGPNRGAESQQHTSRGNAEWGNAAKP